MDVLDDSSPIFAQIAERLADEIADSTLAEGGRVPSSNELAAFYRINPATAAKGLGIDAEALLTLVRQASEVRPAAALDGTRPNPTKGGITVWPAASPRCAG